MAPHPADGPKDPLASGIDRRATPRALARLGVRFSNPGQLAQAMKATTHNIGMGGLCLLTSKSYQPGTELQLTIEVGQGELLELSAVVAWARPGRAVGVRFEGMTEDQRQKLAALVESHKDTPDDGTGP